LLIEPVSAASAKEEEEVVFETRDQLEYLKDPNSKFSIWAVLKQAIGKDLTRFCVPVYFNEPISMV